MSFGSYPHKSSPRHHAWEAGDVVRLGDYAFADATALGFNEFGHARLARPYAHASCVGTTIPTALTGVEYVDMLDLTRGAYTKVDTGRTTT